MREHPRFVTKEQVILDVSGRNELRPVWMSDISKGGLFVRSQDGLPLRTTVVVHIRSPDGTLALEAEVVHVVPAGPGVEAGIGLQFVNLSPERRRAIEVGVEGLAERLEVLGELPSAPGPKAEEVIRAVQNFLRGFEREDLYAALGVEPPATPEEVGHRLASLSGLFESAPEALPPALAARMSHARSLLARVGALMKDPSRRLDYDLRHGHVFPERRMALARGPEAIAALRDRWHHTFPERLRSAERQAAEAIKCINRLDLEGAIAAGTEALEDDPFNAELRDVVRQWQHRAELRRSPLRNSQRKSA